MEDSMTTSQRGQGFIKGFEKLMLTAYADVAGIWTIGWGHTGSDIREGFTITQEYAQVLFDKDISLPEQMVNVLVKVPLRQNQFDALVSLVFNIGSGNFSASTLLRHINLEVSDASRWFLVWNKSHVDGKLVEVAGLTRRREAEKAMFDEVQNNT